MKVHEFLSVQMAHEFIADLLEKNISYRIKFKTFAKRLKRPMVTEVTVYE